MLHQTCAAPYHRLQRGKRLLLEPQVRFRQENPPCFRLKINGLLRRRSLPSLLSPARRDLFSRCRGRADVTAPAHRARPGSRAPATRESPDPCIRSSCFLLWPTQALCLKAVEGPAKRAKGASFGCSLSHAPRNHGAQTLKRALACPFRVNAGKARAGKDEPPDGAPLPCLRGNA